MTKAQQLQKNVFAGKLNQGGGAKLCYVLCVFRGAEQERGHAFFSFILFFFFYFSGELNKKGATHFVSTETEDEVRAWLAGI